MKFVKSSVPPILNDSISCLICCSTVGHSERGIYTRDAAEHFCPWYSKAPRTMAVDNAAVSADGCAIMKSLPPVSPTIRGYDRYLWIFSPIVFQMFWKTPVDPVKWMPAKSGWLKITSPASGPSTNTKLITPGGTPASLNTSISTCALYIWVLAGFQTTTLPIMAADAGRLPAMAVKLNGVSANTNPSNGRCSTRFQLPGGETGGCCA